MLLVLNLLIGLAFSRVIYNCCLFQSKHARLSHRVEDSLAYILHTSHSLRTCEARKAYQQSDEYESDHQFLMGLNENFTILIRTTLPEASKIYAYGRSYINIAGGNSIF